MNCLNHPDTPVAAYCQNCGKPLCSACVRQVAGVTYCEQCLAAKLGVPGTQGAPGGYPYSTTGPLPPGMPDAGPNPALATLLGFIPGVGAMYNGQFIKALIHVGVFVLLIGITDQYGPFGIFIAAWVFYQVFDAHHTAVARRDGLPLPDPFGINELGVKLGGSAGQMPFSGNYTPPAPGAAPFAPQQPPQAAAGAPAPDGGPAYTWVPPAEGYAGFEPVPPAYPSNPPYPVNAKHPEPVGAIILIALGVLFLLGTMGIFHFEWIHHGWPLILIGLGIWIFIKRSRGISGGGL
jgi:TM2 domain-containing membrane protein YozV